MTSLSCCWSAWPESGSRAVPHDACHVLLERQLLERVAVVFTGSSATGGGRQGKAEVLRMLFCHVIVTCMQDPLTLLAARAPALVPVDCLCGLAAWAGDRI
jgi:hypothetical protein